jgi:hypothetical protein
MTGPIDTPLKRYDYYAGPRNLGDLWALTREKLTLRCALSTHRLGWELRLTSGASFSRSQVCKSEAEVSTVSEAWQDEARKKGWS